MARIPYPDPATLPAVDRDFLASLPPLNISRLLAGSSSMCRPLTSVFSAYLNDGVPDTELRETVILRTWHRHGRSIRAHANWRDSPDIYLHITALKQSFVFK